ncbi:uncharacterized protein LOC110684402 [Chenopodium quinoa]|uniref:uncharacterized protein LOC110684402 n=1 Tax=Chenopodium quinoa TaxID=63459 RepID=UPI000B77AD3A|nr:uncharacterized protein LOC110684402 [Chenopodium quinoa]
MLQKEIIWKSFDRLTRYLFNQSKDAGLCDEIWQAFAVFMGILSVGIQGDLRTHSHVAGLGAVTSKDGMTVDWSRFQNH